MSLYNYFNKLGTINYNNEIVNNIITSVRFNELVKKNFVVFYPYTIKEGERAESIAANYYEDERYAWIVYLSNSITDPYYEWPLSVEEFNRFLIKKYGSIEKAINSIAFYRNAWYKDDSMITPAAYNALPATNKKYWNPIVGFNNQIGSYERKKLDLISETNRTVSINLNSSNNIIVGEKAVQTNASGFVASVDTNKVTLKHISGSFANGAITFQDSGASRTVTNVTIVHTAISATETVYWEAVSAYDYENELNESKKSIKLIDRQYLDTIEDQIIELLK